MLHCLFATHIYHSYLVSVDSNEGLIFKGRWAVCLGRIFMQ